MKRYKDKNCALCGDIFTKENLDNEHIIPNALGGHKKIIGLICKTCNSNTGSQWDAKLIDQFSFMNVYFDIKRQRGKVTAADVKTTSGKKMKVLPGGHYFESKPLVNETPFDGGVNIHIEARNQKEARKIVKGLKKKYPTADFSVVDGKIQDYSRRLDEPISLQICPGGLEAGRSVVKSVFMLAINEGLAAEDCDLALKYLTKDGKPFYGHENGEPCFGYYNEYDLIKNRPLGMPLNCVYLKGDPKKNILAGYAEYFGFFKMVVLLSKSYKGKAFESSYAIDPTSGKEVPITVHFDLSLDDLHDAYDYKKIDNEKMKSDFGSVFGPRHKELQDKEQEEFIRESCQKAAEKLGISENQQMTKEEYEEFSKIVSYEVACFITNRTMRYRTLVQRTEAENRV